AEEAVFAAIELVKQRVSQEIRTSNASSKGIQEAMKLAMDLIKQEITLGLGAIVFSGTLLKNSSSPNTKWLYLSWGAWFLSIFLGLLAMGRITTSTVVIWLVIEVVGENLRDPPGRLPPSRLPDSVRLGQ